MIRKVASFHEVGGTTSRRPRLLGGKLVTGYRGPPSCEPGTYKTNSGLDFQVKVLDTFQVVPSSLGGGTENKGCG